MFDLISPSYCNLGENNIKKCLNFKCLQFELLDCNIPSYCNFTDSVLLSTGSQNPSHFKQRLIYSLPKADRTRSHSLMQTLHKLKTLHELKDAPCTYSIEGRIQTRTRFIQIIGYSKGNSSQKPCLFKFCRNQVDSVD